MARFSRRTRSSWPRCTFGSPAILLRSGIGPDQHLSELGIATIANLPVGDRLRRQFRVFATLPITLESRDSKNIDVTQTR